MQLCNFTVTPQIKLSSMEYSVGLLANYSESWLQKNLKTLIELRCWQISVNK